MNGRDLISLCLSKFT